MRLPRGLTVVEPFCGAAGLALGLKRAGFRCLHASDMDSRAVATAKAAGFPAEELKLDGFEAVMLAERLPDDVDLIAGGPPCQPYSVSGKGKGRWDPRDGFPHMLALIREVHPRAVIIENVKGLTSKRHLDYLDSIAWSLERLGYWVPRSAKHPGKVLNSADFGVPQIRKRLFVVALAERNAFLHFDWPEPTHHQTGLVWSKWGPEPTYWNGAGPQGTPSKGEARILRKLESGELQVRWPRWRTVRDAIVGTDGGMCSDGGRTKMPPHRPLHPQDRPSLTIRAQHGGGGGGVMLTMSPDHPDTERLLHPDGSSTAIRAIGCRRGRKGGARMEERSVHEPSVALRASTGGSSQPFAVNDIGMRRLTPAECAALQSFPANWPWQGPKTSVYRQVGNSVPPPLGAAIGLAVYLALKGR